MKKKTPRKLQWLPPCTNPYSGMRNWCAACMANIRGRSNFVGHRGYRAAPKPLIPYLEIPLKRPTEDQIESVKGTGLSDASFAKDYPTLTSYLTDGLWEDGKPRETTALAFSVKDGLWQLGVNDKALKRSLYTSGPTMKDCLKMAEKAIQEGSGHWRQWKRGK